MSRGGRAALVAAVIVIAVVAFIILKPGSSSDTETTPASSASSSSTTRKQSLPGVVVKGGKPVGGIQDLTFAKGQTVQFRVTSDVSGEVHVHGYDVHKEVAPGHPVTFRFPGKIDGEFVVELETRGEQIASLEVTP